MEVNKGQWAGLIDLQGVDVRTLDTDKIDDDYQARVIFWYEDFTGPI